MSDEAVRRSYDTVAQRYAEQLGGELDHKPLDRALLAAFAELVPADGPVGDLGCGPGHVARYLAGLGCPMVGVDLSPAMISVARSSAPELDLRVGSLLDLPFSDGELAGAVAMYSIIHLAPAERAAAYRELARTVRPGGLTLLAFHASDASHRPGDADVVDEMLGLPVELTAYFLGADEVSEALSGWGLGEIARLEREADPDAEYPSRRCYLLSRRR